jgi:multiple sugar transport system ATP-binding protein
MRDGIIEQTGTPLELFDRPANSFVAQFIGSPAMNMFAGQVVARKNAASLELDVGCALPLPSGCAPLAGQRMTAGVRPEHFEIGTGKAAIAATVDVVEPLGSSTQLALSAKGQAFIATFNERLACKSGETLGLIPQHGHLHLFDAVTGQRITLPE